MRMSENEREPIEPHNLLPVFYWYGTQASLSWTYAHITFSHSSSLRHQIFMLHLQIFAGRRLQLCCMQIFYNYIHMHYLASYDASSLFSMSWKGLEAQLSSLRKYAAECRLIVNPGKSRAAVFTGDRYKVYYLRSSLCMAAGTSIPCNPSIT